MKKVIKLIIVIIILIIAIILINYIRNTVISNKIIMAGNDFFNSSNYHITIKTTMSDDYNVINEIYYKNDTCLINTYNNNKLTEIYWKNLTEEKISYYPETLHTMNEFNEELITSLKDELMLKGNSVPIFDFIAKKDNSYIIKNQYINHYFNKETGLLVKKEYYLEENYNTLNNISEYKFELNTVTDKQVKKPEI